MREICPSCGKDMVATTEAFAESELWDIESFMRATCTTSTTRSVARGHGHDAGSRWCEQASSEGGLYGEGRYRPGRVRGR